MSKWNKTYRRTLAKNFTRKYRGGKWFKLCQGSSCKVEEPKPKPEEIPVFDFERVETLDEYKKYREWEDDVFISLKIGDENRKDTKQVEHFLRELEKKKSPFYEKFMFLVNNNIPFKTAISITNFHNYADVFNIDEYFFTNNFNRGKKRNTSGYRYKPILVKNEDGSYGGSIWCFWRPELPFLGMYGIRSSLFNFLTNRSGIASKILKAVEEFAIELGKSILIVPHPLDKMRQILLKKGFIQSDKGIEGDTDTEETDFLDPIVFTSDYLTKTL
jgi:hypothetical protein